MGYFNIMKLGRREVISKWIYEGGISRINGKLRNCVVLEFKGKNELRILNI